MYVTRLQLFNFRGARSLSLDFQRRLNVFYGENGAGKSTVLDAIAIMLSWVVSRIRHAGSSGRPIGEDDITIGNSSASIELTTCWIEGSDVYLQWKVAKTKAGHQSFGEKSQLYNLNDYTATMQSLISEKSEQTNLPIFVYYPVNRAVLDIPLRIREHHSFSLLTAYDDALTSGANFRMFFEWFREREDIENESIRRGEPSPDPQLEAVRSALTQFLPEFSNLTVRRSPLRMEVDKNGKTLIVNQLSDGEKCLIAFIGDLARRLAIANPGSTIPLQYGTGIVLVDEIDLHLHPKWQRIVVPKLLQVFPNCQFFISTHSPSILTHVNKENIYSLKLTNDGIVAEQPEASFGMNVDRIMEELMELPTTRPDEVEEQLHEMYVAIDDGALEQACEQIAKLKEKIGQDSELAKAEVLIRRKEIIGK